MTINETENINMKVSDMAEQQPPEHSYYMDNDEGRLGFLMEAIRDGYYETDIHGTFTYCNPSLTEILGYSREELIGMNNRQYMDDKNAKKAFDAFNQVYVSGGFLEELEFDLIKKDASTCKVRLSVYLMRNPEKEISGFRGIARDISDKKTLLMGMKAAGHMSQEARDATLLELVKLTEYRIDDVGFHLERMRRYSRMLAKELSRQNKYKELITETYIENIYYASIFHDIGKVGIPDEVLLKPGKLTDDEFEVIKKHSTIGGDALKAIEKKTKSNALLSLAQEIAYYHHEKWSGKGYPEGLYEDTIPVSARIVAVADVYDALTSKTVYKDTFSHAEAVKIIVNEKGRQFDPDVVDAFMAKNKEFSAVSDQYQDSLI